MVALGFVETGRGEQGIREENAAAAVGRGEKCFEISPPRRGLPQYKCVGERDMEIRGHPFLYYFKNRRAMTDQGSHELKKPPIFRSCVYSCLWDIKPTRILSASLEDLAFFLPNLGYYSCI